MENKSGIIIPETTRKDKANSGEVLAVGREVKEVKIGDKIMFNYPKARFFEGEGELDANTAKRVLIKEEDIFLTYE
ncbi:MAG: co-chaperone GroES family protein [Thermotogota bacterium]|nr:co-chaperone GroES family protein [Thermotogota bacterium]